MIKKLQLFLCLVFISFGAVSCQHEDLPPNVTGTWGAVSLETYNINDEDEVYNESYYTFWENEKTLILNSDNTWEEKNGSVSYNGTWTVKQLYGTWILTLTQPTVSKVFSIKQCDNTYLVLHETNNSWNAVTTFVKIQ